MKHANIPFVPTRADAFASGAIRCVHSDDDSTCWVGDAFITAIKGSDLTAWIEPKESVSPADEYRFRLFDNDTFIGWLIIGQRDIPYNRLHLAECPSGSEPVRLAGFHPQNPAYPFMISTIHPYSD